MQWESGIKLSQQYDVKLTNIERDEDCYHSTASLVLKVGGKLFRYQADILADASPVFKSMLGTAQASMTEGLSDENPIILHEPFTSENTKILMLWFRRQLKDKELTVGNLCDLLELGTFLEMECARDTAITLLSSQQHVSPVLMLCLGVSFHVAEWIEPAFRQLLRAHWESLTSQDIVLLGPNITRILFSTQQAIQNLRLLIAIHPYKLMHQTSCQTPGPEHSYCQKNWSAGWRLGFAPHYLNPEVILTPEEALRKLSTTSMIGVTPECHRAAIANIEVMKVFEKEYDIIGKALGQVMELVGIKFYRKL
ncbi:hypothetical protein M422DRAFT_775859 [Sphaerobolus stellatus SS14]|nr:hypothetical protein M422DRAFT_775859 [Sphaerobolus stellatus SS14]